MKFALRSASFLAASFVLLFATLVDNASAAPALSGVSVHVERQSGVGVTKVPPGDAENDGPSGLKRRQWPPGYSKGNAHVTTDK